MYSKGKTRKFDYTTVPGTNKQQQEIDITNLYSGKNSGNDDTYLGKIKFNF
jgi:hypothetical protein